MDLDSGKMETLVYNPYNRVENIEGYALRSAEQLEAIEELLKEILKAKNKAQ